MSYDFAEFDSYIQRLRDALGSSSNQISDSDSDSRPPSHYGLSYSDDDDSASFHSAQSQTSSFDINDPQLDWDALAEFYRERGYVYTPDTSDDDSAEGSDALGEDSDDSGDDAASFSSSEIAASWEETRRRFGLDENGEPSPAEARRRVRLGLCLYCGTDHSSFHCGIIVNPPSESEDSSKESDDESSSADEEIYDSPGRLTLAERQRRYNLRLCAYCGGQHHIANCEALALKNARNAYGAEESASS